jgi:hypothetical protein
MINTYRVPSFCNPAKLFEALDAAGMRVATVRADWAKLDDPVALWAVVVFKEGYTPDMAKVKAVVDAHIQSPDLKGKQPSAIQGPPPNKEQSLSALERL